MHMEFAELETLCILGLQVVTAAALGAALVHSMWNRQLPEVVYQLQHGFCNLRARLKQPNKPLPGNARVEAKFLETLCRLMTNGCRVVVVALFLRLLAIQGPLMNNERHQLQPSLDLSNIISYPIVLFLVFFNAKVISGRTLDAWYVLLQVLCVLPLLSTAPEDVTSVSLITLLPRVLLGLISRHAFLSVLGNVVHWFLAVRQVGFQLQSDTVLAQSAELLLLFSATFSIRHALYEIVRMSFELSTRTIELSAVSGLLLGYCDAVVEVDKDLRLTDDSRQFSTLLLHGHGMSAGSLANNDFLSFFHPDDREHIRVSLDSETDSSTSTQPLALNARMQDCLGNFVKVEILHTSFQNADGQKCRLVGMREFQDFNSVALPLPTDPAAVRLPLAPVADTSAPPEDTCSVVFDATSFDILSLSGPFKKLCLEHGADDISEGMSIFDLSTGNDPTSLAGYIQTAVNGLEPEKMEGDLLVIRDLQLFGTCKVEATLQFQTDKMLDAIIGSLCINPAPTPTMTLTAKNLAKLTGHRQRCSSKGSRSSKSTRSSRRRLSGESGEHVRQGSIFDLRKQVTAL